MKSCKRCGISETPDASTVCRGADVRFPYDHEWETLASSSGTTRYIETMKLAYPLGKDSGNPKDKLGDAKPQMHLIPVGAMASVAKVMELGAKKYGPYNWRSKKVRSLVYAAAALRHLYAWIGGENNDPESGQPHWAHMVACGLIVLDAMACGMAVDDRTWLSVRDEAGQNG